MKNIYLIGARACGKTTVGHFVAAKLNYGFYDSDAVFAGKAGCDISYYVKKHGWDNFREREVEILYDLSMQGKAVISCGGGVVLREKNLDILRNNFTVYLKTDAKTLSERLLVDPVHDQRPSLTGKSLADEVRSVLEEREGLYSGCSSLIVNGGDGVQDVCSLIVNEFKLIDKGGGA